MFKYGTSAHCLTWVSEFGNRAICIWNSAWVAMWTSDSWGRWYANCGSSFSAAACTWMSEPAYSNYIWWSSDRLLAPGSWGLSFCLSKSAPFGHISLICMSSWDSWDSWLLDLLISTPRMQNWEFFFSFPCQSAAELLGCKPDIACYSKLLTGGVVPLGATLASESVFETFMGNSKVITNLLVLNPSLATFTFW